LIGFWSRLPGVGMPSPFYVLYLLDFVDFFSLIVAVNIGGFQGAVFSAFLNLVSRAAGIFPTWLGVAKDTISQFVVCLIIPYVYLATGGDIFMSMVWYSVIRILMFFPLRLLPSTNSFPQFLIEMAGGGTAVLVINAAYAKLFGNFLDNLLERGAQFSWVLFIFATVVIIVFKIAFFGKTKSKRSMFSDLILRPVARKVKRATDVKDENRENKERRERNMRDRRTERDKENEGHGRHVTNEKHERHQRNEMNERHVIHRRHNTHERKPLKEEVHDELEELKKIKDSIDF